MRYLHTLLLLVTSIHLSNALIVDHEEQDQAYIPFKACFPHGTLIDPYWLITSARHKTLEHINLGEKRYKVLYTIIHPKWQSYEPKLKLNSKDPFDHNAYYDIKLIRLEKPNQDFSPLQRARTLPPKSIVNILSFNENRLAGTVKNEPQKPQQYGAYLQFLGKAKLNNTSQKLPLRFDYKPSQALTSNTKMDQDNPMDVGAPVFITSESEQTPLLAGQLFAVGENPEQFSAINLTGEINDWIDHIILLDSTSGSDAVKKTYSSQVIEHNKPTIKKDTTSTGHFRERQNIVNVEDLFKLPDYANCSLSANLFAITDYPWYLGLTFESEEPNLKHEKWAINLSKTIKLMWDRIKGKQTTPKLLFVPTDEAYTQLDPLTYNLILKDSTCRSQFILDHILDQHKFPISPQFALDPTKQITLTTPAEPLLQRPGGSSQIILNPNLNQNYWEILFNSNIGQPATAHFIKKMHPVADCLRAYQIDRPIITAEFETLLKTKTKGVTSIFKEDNLTHQDKTPNSIWAKIQTLPEYSLFSSLVKGLGLEPLLQNNQVSGITLILPNNQYLETFLQSIRYHNWNEVPTDQLKHILKQFILVQKIEQRTQNVLVQAAKTDDYGLPIAAEIKKDVQIFGSANAKTNEELRNVFGADEPQRVLVLTEYEDGGTSALNLANNEVTFQTNNISITSLLNNTTVFNIQALIKGYELGTNALRFGCKPPINCSNGIIYPCADNSGPLDLDNELYNPLIAKYQNPKPSQTH